MIIAGMIVMFLFAAIAIAIMNKGGKDKEYKRREAYWARFKDK